MPKLDDNSPRDKCYDIQFSTVEDTPPLWASELQRSVNEVLATQTAIRETFDKVAAEVSPVIDSLSSNAMFKMFMGKGGLGRKDSA